MPSEVDSLLKYLQDFGSGSDDQQNPATYTSIGFTIYRTDYSDGTEETWQTLLQEIRHSIEVEISYLDSLGVLYEAIKNRNLEKLGPLIAIDARSDAATLSNRTAEELREIYKAGGAGGKPLRNKLMGETFMYADAEVLRNMAASQNEGSKDKKLCYVKMADVDYVAEKHKVSPNNRRLPDGQYYWGMMRVDIDSIFNIWNVLRRDCFEDVVPQMPERNSDFLPVYNGLPGGNKTLLRKNNSSLI